MSESFIKTSAVFATEPSAKANHLMEKTKISGYQAHLRCQGDLAPAFMFSSVFAQEGYSERLAIINVAENWIEHLGLQEGDEIDVLVDTITACDIFNTESVRNNIVAVKKSNAPAWTFTRDI